MATTGNKGKFTERLRNIALGRKKKDINLSDNKNILVEDAKTTYNNFLKVAAAIPLLVYDNVIKDDSLHNDKANDKLDVNNETYDSNKVVNFEGSKDLIGNIVELKIVSEHMWYLKGKCDKM